MWNQFLLLHFSPRWKEKVSKRKKVKCEEICQPKRDQSLVDFSRFYEWEMLKMKMMKKEMMLTMYMFVESVFKFYFPFSEFNFYRSFWLFDKSAWGTFTWSDNVMCRKLEEKKKKKKKKKLMMMTMMMTKKQWQKQNIWNGLFDFE